MRIGKWRGMPRTLALAIALGLGLAGASSAQTFDPFHTIPREVDAYDFTTGGAYMAPPVPYGHYAKDPLGGVHKFLSCPTCQLHGLLGGGGGGNNLFHHGDGDGQHGGGCGLFGHGKNCGHGDSSNIVADGPHGHAGGLPAGTAVVGDYSSGLPYLPSGQSVVQPSSQAFCGEPGCGVKSRHSHFGHSVHANKCGSCGGGGCGACGGSGVSGHGHGTGCKFCGGNGCKHCLSGLGSSLQGKLASLTAGLHRQRVTWFVGAGGPVPLTPGYVPYVVSTRSPRDFFAFAPMNPDAP
jgi:hypothetical protein